MAKKKPVVFLAGALTLALLAVFGIFSVQSGHADEQQPLFQYPEYPPTPTIAPKPGDSAAATRGRVFNDSFNTDSISNYDLVDLSGETGDYSAVWEIKDGALVQDGVGALREPESTETLAIVRKDAGNDYTISAKVYDQGNASFGLVARRTGNSFYRFQIIGEQYEATPKIRLEKVVDGTITALATVDGPGYQLHTWYTVDMTVKGDSISVQMDGKPLISATDSSLASGSAGVYTRAFGSIQFDDITLATAQ